MKLRKRFKTLGIVLIAMGIFIIMAQPFSMTGAVIDLSSAISRIWFFVGISLIFGGIFLTAIATKVKGGGLETILGQFGEEIKEAQILSDSTDGIKQRNYKLTNEEYFWALKSVSAELNKNSINYVLVGGLATQLQIAKMLGQGKNLKDSDLASLLRSTDDFDIALEGTNEKEIMDSIIDKYKDLSEDTDDAIYEMDVERAGAKRPIISVDSTNVDFKQRIMMNFSYDEKDLKKLDPKVYKQVLDSAEEIDLDYDQNLHLSVRVARPEYLIAAKLTRYNDRDKYDIKMLLKAAKVSGNPIDLEDIRTILLESDQKDMYEERLDEFSNL
jgi:hypothetical protein